MTKPWADFDSDSLYTMYSSSLKMILDAQFDLHDDTYIPETPFRRIHDEDSLESLIVV